MSKAKEMYEREINFVNSDKKRVIENYVSEIKQQNKELIDLLSEIADYLNRNNQNYIGSGSIFNQQINNILDKK